MVLLDFLGTRWEAGGWVIPFFFLHVSHMGSKLGPWGSWLPSRRAGLGVRVLTSGTGLAVVRLSCHPALALAGSLAWLPFSAFFYFLQVAAWLPSTLPQTILSLASVSGYWLCFVLV